eukprot:2532996-Amphidinium_carterae.1
MCVFEQSPITEAACCWDMTFSFVVHIEFCDLQRPLYCSTLQTWPHFVLMPAVHVRLPVSTCFALVCFQDNKPLEVKDRTSAAIPGNL